MFFWNVVLVVCGYVWWTIYTVSYPLGGVPVVQVLISTPWWGASLLMLAVVTVISIVVTTTYDYQILTGAKTLEEIGIKVMK